MNTNPATEGSLCLGQPQPWQQDVPGSKSCGCAVVEKVLNTADLVNNLVTEYHAAIADHQKKYTNTFAKLIS